MKSSGCPSSSRRCRPISDDPDRKAVFLLLGSASWDLIAGISETLAGRILFVDVAGFSVWEVGTAHLNRLWMRGGFPRAWLASSPEAWTRWMRSFTRTFLERDIPGLSSRVAPDALGRFWRMLAHWHGQLWNASELARSMDVSPAAVNHYRDLLAGSFMIRVLPPWFENLGKRLVKSPRVFLRDSGVLHFLLGLEDPDQLPLHPRYGASWEGFALEQTLIAHGGHEAYFYRTQRGAELDLLLLRGGKRFGFEFKCSDAPKTTKSMHIVIDDLGLEHLWVVYPGELEYPLGRPDHRRAAQQGLEPAPIAPPPTSLTTRRQGTADLRSASRGSAEQGAMALRHAHGSSPTSPNPGSGDRPPFSPAPRSIQPAAVAPGPGLPDGDEPVVPSEGNRVRHFPSWPPRRGPSRPPCRSPSARRRTQRPNRSRSGETTPTMTPTQP